MSTYTHFQYIAYQVPTVGTNGPNFLEMPDGGMPPGFFNFPAADQALINAVSNVDGRRRVARFYGAALEAYNWIYNNDRGSKFILKIFMAPEFYFRPTTANSTIVPQGPAYSYIEYREIKTALRALFNKFQFRNWLIIPGTIMWMGTGVIGNRPPTANNVYFNTSMYIAVGFWTSPGTSVIEKEESSHIDGLPTTFHGIPAGGGHSTDETWTIYQTTAKKKGHVFSHYGTKMGLEICLEHGNKLLKNILKDWKIGLFGNKLQTISLQLITSGGMPILNKNITTIPNGYIMRTDGLGPGIQSQLHQVTGYVNKTFGRPLPVEYTHVPSYAQIAPAEVPLHTINLAAANLAVPDPGCTGGSYFPQEVKIYNRLPIAY